LDQGSGYKLRHGDLVATKKQKQLQFVDGWFAGFRPHHPLDSPSAAKARSRKERRSPASWLDGRHPFDKGQIICIQMKVVSF
jgi:hypothetical protein